MRWYYHLSQNIGLNMHQDLDRLWTIGTRGSPLALVQTEMVTAKLQACYPAARIARKTIATTGDKIQDRSLADIGGKGLFLKEIEKDLLAGHIDFAVHSLKDMEANVTPELKIAAVLPRENPADVFIALHAPTLMDLPPYARVGTCSPRRMIQLKQLRSDLQIVMMRGNVQTRLDKLARGDVDALILAYAGLSRLNLVDQITSVFPLSMMLPAVAQGVIAIECRCDDSQTIAFVAPLNHLPTWQCISAEREMLRALGGNCHTPIGGHAVILDNGHIHLTGMIGTMGGEKSVFGEGVGEMPTDVGQLVADALRSKIGGDWPLNP